MTLHKTKRALITNTILKFLKSKYLIFVWHVSCTLFSYVVLPWWINTVIVVMQCVKGDENGKVFMNLASFLPFKYEKTN